MSELHVLVEFEPDARVYDPMADRAAVSWRTLCFLDAGLSEAEATALAVRRDLDREQVERMVKGGATAAQVLDLLT